MRWCDEHRNDFPDEEFVKENGSWIHLRGGRHRADEPFRIEVSYDVAPRPPQQS